jgi:hypothetical protein
MGQSLIKAFHKLSRKVWTFEENRGCPAFAIEMTRFEGDEGILNPKHSAHQ